MLFPEILNVNIAEILTSFLKKEVRILNMLPISGGDINKAVKVISNEGNYFLKWNDANKFPEMFTKEAKGLTLLASKKCIGIPEVITDGSAGKFSFLLLEYINSGEIKPDFWHQFGKQLAHLHKNPQQNFGLDHDNYIGSLHQSNNVHNNWATFFVEERIRPLLSRALASKLLEYQDLKQAEKLFIRLSEIFPPEPPALLHGDLWSGNFMVNECGMPCLVDPAVYYGSREMDIAMSKLFGGFKQEFYESYNYYYPLEAGWEQRLDICNLYPLLVHLNLFGRSYAGQVKSILRLF